MHIQLEKVEVRRISQHRIYLKISLTPEKLGFWNLPAVPQCTGPVPPWPGASLIWSQAKNSSQAAEHIGPCDLLFISLNKGRLDGRGQLQGKKGMEYILIVGTFYCFQFLPFSPTPTPPPTFLSSYSILPFQKKEGRVWALREGGKKEGGREGRKGKAESLRLLHLLPSSLTWFHHHPKAVIGHFSPQLYCRSGESIESVRQKLHKW